VKKERQRKKDQSDCRMSARFHRWHLELSPRYPVRGVLDPRYTS
jgi:hypothetical protein